MGITEEQIRNKATESADHYIESKGTYPDGFEDGFNAGIEWYKEQTFSSYYFDIPDSQVNFAYTDEEAYKDEQGWYMIDGDGNKQRPDEKYIKPRC